MLYYHSSFRFIIPLSSSKFSQDEDSPFTGSLMIWVQFNGGIKALQRLGDFSQLSKGLALIAPGLAMFRIDL